MRVPRSPDAAPRLTQSSTSLRSAVARNALLCIGEALAACDACDSVVDGAPPALAARRRRPSYYCTAFPNSSPAPLVRARAPGAMVDALLSRAAADKRFLRDAASGALKALATHCTTHEMIITLCRASRRHRHPLARQAAAALLARALRAAPAAVVASMPDADPAPTLAATTAISAAAPPAAGARASSAVRPQTAPASAAAAAAAAAGHASSGQEGDGEDAMGGSSFPVVGDDAEWKLGDLIATCAAHAQGRVGVERQAGAAAARAVAASVGKVRWHSGAAIS